MWPEKKILASKKVSSSVKSVKGIKEYAISEVRKLEKGVGVKLTGVVSALPGIFGTQYFYLFDGLSGIQIYQNKKLFPDLLVGDRVMISGEVSESSGRKRVNVKTIEGFDILSTGENVEPTLFKSVDLEDELFGSLIKVSGEITELKSGYMYLDDLSGEVVVYFKPGAGINKKNFKEGMRVEVAGIYENSTAGGQVWPRSESDIKIIYNKIEAEPEYNMVIDDEKKTWYEQYFSGALGGLSVILAGFLVRTRGLFFKQGIKKFFVAISRFFRKG